jgi:glycosyltransferase involved in cell wall biosynthesis
MRILLVYNAHRHGGGSDAVAKRTAELLTRAGHTVSVFTRSSKELSGLCGSLQAFFCGIYSPRVIRDFRRTLKEFRPDVVHAHEVYPLITPWIFRVCKKSGIPVVMTCHDYRTSCPVATHFRNGSLCFECAGGHELACIRHNCCGSRFKSLAYALRNSTARLFHLFSNVDLFLTPSEKSKEILCRYSGLSLEQVIAVGNPVSAFANGHNRAPSELGSANAGQRSGKKHENIQKEESTDNRELITDNYQQPTTNNQQLTTVDLRSYAAYAGRFEPEKGFDLLVQTLDGTGIPLQVAGDASAYLASGRQVPAFVSFSGHLDRGGMGDFYRQARLLVVPSLWDETFGLVVAEALSCGTPVVVTNLGALAEVAGPGGLVVPAGDVAALREAVSRLWNDAALCRNMALAGREHVKQYSDEAYVSHLLRAYERVLKVEGFVRLRQIRRPVAPSCLAVIDEGGSSTQAEGGKGGEGERLKGRGRV